MNLGNPDGIGPRPFRLLCGDDEIASLVDQRASEVVRSFVVSDSWREDAAGDSQTVKIELLRPVHHVTDLLPVDQVLALENWYPWKVGKAGAHEIIVAPDPANAGIRIEARKNGITEFRFVLRARS